MIYASLHSNIRHSEFPRQFLRAVNMQSNRVALVTGANQGVGLQVAKELVANGLMVLVRSHSFGQGEAAAKEIGPGAIPLQLDVTDLASITSAAKRVQDEFGRLDVLIQNAAISNTNRQPGQPSPRVLPGRT